MRDILEEKPLVVAEHPEYILVRDETIPCISKENIVLKPAGLRLIAKHYFQKYGIPICICGEFLKIHELAQKIKDHLLSATRTYSDAKKIGFIFISQDDPDDIFGHALPMVWEKTPMQEHLFFLDSTQYLGETQSPCIMLGVQAFRQALITLMPNVKLWSIFGCRQIDYSSCYTDALVILKDALLATSLTTLVDAKIKEIKPDITIFYAPEILLRTAQVGSYPMRSYADLNYLIGHDQKQTGTPKETLADFRQRFEESVQVNGSVKKFGTFTLFKAQHYVVEIERRKLAESLVSSVLRTIHST